jgi:hypothetical protein
MEQSPRAIRRRDLLVWGGAAALLPAFPRMASAQAAQSDASAVRNMSVGFVEGSEAWPTLRKVSIASLSRGHRSVAGVEAASHTVLPAVDMIAGDQTLASELVRVGVRGLYPVGISDRIDSVRLTVLFPSPDPARRRPLPFFAWSYESRPAPSPSPPLEFVAPLGIDGGFRLRLDVVPAAAQGLSRRTVADLAREPLGGSFATDFTVDWFAGRPKLQRGVYLLGLAGGTWASEQSLPVQRPGRQRPLHLLSLILTVDPVHVV